MTSAAMECFLMCLFFAFKEKAYETCCHKMSDKSPGKLKEVWLIEHFRNQ